jgi:hypothetical protein
MSAKNSVTDAERLAWSVAQLLQDKVTGTAGGFQDQSRPTYGYVLPTAAARPLSSVVISRRDKVKADAKKVRRLNPNGTD